MDHGGQRLLLMAATSLTAWMTSRSVNAGDLAIGTVSCANGSSGVVLHDTHDHEQQSCQRIVPRVHTSRQRACHPPYRARRPESSRSRARPP
jgi:hypothetical protein